MKVYEYKGKSLEEIFENENLNKEDIVYKSLDEEKSLFKGTKQVIKVVELKDISDFIKEKALEITKLMGIEANAEANIRERIVNVSIHSDQNPLLIGQKGKTLEALKTIIKQMLLKETGMYLKFNLDIGEYKKEHEKQLKVLAKRVAREVSHSKVEAKLDPMNSFERKVIHSELTDNKYVETVSEGEEPNRYIVIKPKGN